jgi:hypothetical protein
MFRRRSTSSRCIRWASLLGKSTRPRRGSTGTLGTMQTQQCNATERGTKYVGCRKTSTQDKLALMLIKAEKITPGLDLGLPGYRNLKVIPGTPHDLAGSGWISIDKSNVRQYPF